ncbi:MAG: GNAT family N-acetyltransferase [Cyanobacteria bacterium P01_H01_bin.21]
MPVRNIGPSDYQPIISVLNTWWGGRKMSDMLPKLFFVHFCETSFMMESNEQLLGFLIGFCSQTHPHEAYIHFAGVNPECRNQGIGRTLYETFFTTVKELGCYQVRCVTSPVNQQSIAYHLHMGFQAEPGDSQVNNVPYHSNYDGPREDRVLFVKGLNQQPLTIATNTREQTR